MSSMQVYADRVETEPQYQTNMVTLEGVDVSNVVAEFPAEDILDCLDFSDILRYVTDRLEDRTCDE